MTSGLSSEVSGHLKALGLFAGITLIILLPLVLNLGSSTLVSSLDPAKSRDKFHFIWNFWWVQNSLATGQNVLYTNLIFYPQGTSLVLHTLDVADAVLSWPVAFLAGETVGYNFVMIVSFVVSGFASYLLAYHFTKNKMASFAAGIIFAFFPQHYTQALSGHPNLASAGWLPAYLLALVIGFGEKKIKFALVGGVLLAISTYTDLQLLFMAASITVVYLGFELFRLRTGFFAPRRLLGLGILLGTWLFIAFPFISQVYVAIAQSQKAAPPIAQTYLNSAKPGLYLTPSPYSLLYGPFVLPLYQGLTGGAPQWVIFIGYVPLLLAGVGLWKAKGSAKYMFLALAVVAYVISLGPTPAPGITLQTPYTLLYDSVGAIQFFRALARFSTVLMIGVAVLAAFGLDYLTRAGGTKIPIRFGLPRKGGGISQKEGFGGKLVGLLFVALILMEFAPIVTESQTTISPAYGIIASDTSQFSVLELPPNVNTTQAALNAQISYDKPLVNGKVSQSSITLPTYAAIDPFLRNLTSPVFQSKLKDITDKSFSSKQLALAVLSFYQIKYIVVHIDQYRRAAGLQIVNSSLFANVGPPVYQDKRTMLFVVPKFVFPSDVAASQGNTPLVLFGDGWGGLQKIGRNATTPAILLVFAPTAGEYRIDLKTSEASVCLSSSLISQTVCGALDPSTGHLVYDLRLAGGENAISLETFDNSSRTFSDIFIGLLGP